MFLYPAGSISPHFPTVVVELSRLYLQRITASPALVYDVFVRNYVLRGIILPWFQGGANSSLKLQLRCSQFREFTNLGPALLHLRPAVRIRNLRNWLFVGRAVKLSVSVNTIPAFYSVARPRLPCFLYPGESGSPHFPPRLMNYIAYIFAKYRVGRPGLRRFRTELIFTQNTPNRISWRCQFGRGITALPFTIPRSYHAERFFTTFPPLTEFVTKEIDYL